MILDLAGYTVDRRLADLVALEPSAGDGAFLRSMVKRLVESCERHGIDLTEASEAIQAFEIDSASAARAVDVVYATLVELGIEAAGALRLAQGWIKDRDFLEAALGFPIADFVVGNPPYIRLEEIPAEKAQFYRSSFKETMRGRADLYVAFYEAALIQLKPGGVCAYICADRWLLNDYGSALRNFITTKGFAVKFVIEMHDVDAFESEVDAYPAITVIARDTQGPVIVAKALPGIEIAARDRVVNLITGGRSNPEVRASRFEEWFMGEEPWPCSSPERLRCLKELEARCRPLEDAATGTKVGIGVATGADDIFVIEGKPDIESDRILPLAMAHDLEGGRVAWSGHYLVNPWDENGLVPIREYPQMLNFLAPHRERLAGRHTAKKEARPDRWHKTIDRVTMSLLGRKKLFIADIKDRLLPAFDPGKTYPHHNLYYIVSNQWDLSVLGGLLMSAVGEFFIHCYGVKMRGGYYRFQAQYLRRIRVPVPHKIPLAVANQLREAFETQNVDLATKAALKAYEIDQLPP